MDTHIQREALHLKILKIIAKTNLHSKHIKFFNCYRCYHLSMVIFLSNEYLRVEILSTIMALKR